MLRQNIRFGGPLTPIVKKLMIINGAVFLFQLFVSIFYPNLIEHNFGLSHNGLMNEFKLWQVFTYMFLHGGFMHILFNLFALWMFSGDLENEWGSAQFLRYYLVSGVGAGVCIALMNYFIYLKYGASPVTIGASGAVYAILLAYGMTWPNRQVLLYFVFPVKMKYLVIGFGLIEFFGTIGSAAGGGNISHIGHLGGLISGFVYMMYLRRKPSSPSRAGAGEPGFIDKVTKDMRLKKKQKEIERRIEAKKIIDTLLEKIAKHGMSSLTADEKKKLEWARKNYFPGREETLH
ncbi:MAG TPA: rhomboid family intramembrane serine protease [Spirochaetota bacterium]|nr:rhomboid family intramembrane serine protease [Spirochaetota bacterium]HPQ51967.1 rhomboid family intramembrane serine protease [Spirochaetota bacterium]